MVLVGENAVGRPSGRDIGQEPFKHGLLPAVGVSQFTVPAVLSMLKPQHATSHTLATHLLLLIGRIESLSQPPSLPQSRLQAGLVWAGPA